MAHDSPLEPCIDSLPYDSIRFDRCVAEIRMDLAAAMKQSVVTSQICGVALRLNPATHLSRLFHFFFLLKTLKLNRKAHHGFRKVCRFP